MLLTCSAWAPAPRTVVVVHPRQGVVMAVVTVDAVNEFVYEVLVTPVAVPPVTDVNVVLIVVTGGGYWAENSFPAAVSTVTRTVPEVYL